MSEENMNNNEETSALFVSAQKKKQAEEEARRKAEEEKARREAAEAEVARMEQELEERKRRAEEERQALEQAAAEAKASGGNRVEKLKSAVNTAAGSGSVKSKSKVPLFAIIGAAAVVVILVAVFALKGKGGDAGTGAGAAVAAAEDPSSIEFNKEYTSTVEGVDLTISYPEALFPQVTEEGNNEGTTITLGTGDESGAPTMVMANMLIEKGTLGFLSAKELQKTLTDMGKSILTDSDSPVTIIDEQSTDVSADNPGKYSYKCTFSYGEGAYGAYSSWLKPGKSGDIYAIAFFTVEKADNADGVAKLRDLFEEKNVDDAIKVPGENPPKEASTDGRLEADPIHMGIVVPADTFKKLDTGSDDLFYAWSDNNGAMFILEYKAIDEMSLDELPKEGQDVMDFFKERSQKGINQIHPYVESRMYLGDLPSPDGVDSYNAEFRDIIGGVTFWEGYNTNGWTDVRTNRQYTYSLILLAPEKNKDIYKEIFTRAIDRLEDI